MKIKQASRLNAVKEYYFSKKLKEIGHLRKGGKDIINLGIGNPDLPPATNVRHELQKSCWEELNHGYQSYRGIPVFREAIVDWYQKYYNVELDSEAEVLPLIGSKEGITHIAMSFLEEGDEALVPNPGYPAYQTASVLAGANIIEYNLKEKNNWLPDLESLEKQDLSRVKIMWVNYPNMPTGAAASKSFFKSLIEFANRHQILIVNDNPYSFILRENPLSLLSVEGAKEVALELNSLSKSHNMAGWRVGMLLGKEAFINTVLKFKSNMDSGMFLPVQMGAVEALKNPPLWYSDLNNIYQKRQQEAFRILDELNCVYQKDQGGLFVWAKIPGNYPDAYAFSDDVLFDAEVFITPGGIFGSQGNRYVRISLCNKIEVFQKCLKKVKKWKGKKVISIQVSEHIQKKIKTA